MHMNNKSKLFKMPFWSKDLVINHLVRKINSKVKVDMDREILNHKPIHNI